MTSKGSVHVTKLASPSSSSSSSSYCSGHEARPITEMFRPHDSIRPVFPLLVVQVFFFFRHLRSWFGLFFHSLTLFNRVFSFCANIFSTVPTVKFFFVFISYPTVRIMNLISCSVSSSYIPLFQCPHFTAM